MAELNMDGAAPEAVDLAQPTRDSAAELDELRTDVENLRDELLAREEVLHEALYELRDTLARDQSDEQRDYLSSIRRVRSLVRETVPRESHVLVVSKGDEELLALHGRATGHFPQDLDGRCAGYYPGSSLGAIGHLEALRALGASHLVIPPASRWWLDHYHEFDRHLRKRYQIVAESRESGLVIDLTRAEAAELNGWEQLRATVSEWALSTGRDPVILNWGSTVDLGVALAEHTIFDPVENASHLSYLDGTVDVVVIGLDSDAEKIAEAKRVAACGVLRVVDGGTDGPTVETLFVAPEVKSASPKSVSILVATSEDEPELLATVGSLLDTFPPGEVEVVLVGNGGAESAAVCSSRLGADRVRVVAAPAASGFPKLVDAGASAAEGEIVVLVGAGVALLPDWHSALLRDFRDLSDAGVIGGKILLFDGRLAHGGGQIRDRLPINLGFGDRKPEAPAYATTRPVDFASPALVAADRPMLRRALKGCPTDSTPLEAMVALGSELDASSRVYFEPESVAVLLRPPPRPWMLGIEPKERRKRAVGKGDVT